MGRGHQTARRKKEIRDKILEALDSLNGTVSHTTAEIRLYSRNQDLRDKSESLYIAIMEFVKMTMRYLRKSSVSEWEERGGRGGVGCCRVTVASQPTSMKACGVRAQGLSVTHACVWLRCPLAVERPAPTIGEWPTLGHGPTGFTRHEPWI
jgi:hypothetical protein